MTNEQLLAEIREANLTYLMLAQTLIRQDKAEAVFRLGMNEEACDILASLSAAQVLKRGRAETKLSFYEVQLLKLLHERAGQPVGRDEILDKVWGIEAASNNRTVDNFVVKLRKKVEPQPDEPRHILTVYGVGYKLVV